MKIQKMQLISAIELHQAILKGQLYEIIDIRELYEYNSCNIGSIHIPMDQICSRTNELPKDKNLVIMCRSGKRAEAVANILSIDFSIPNVYYLDGGLLAWKEEIDTTLDLD